MKNKSDLSKREIDIVVISDVHLGTYGCRAKELLSYLRSIQPGHLIINGDFIDIWQFKKKYFPKSHLKVIKKIIDFSAKNTKVTYITGNHDEMLRKFCDSSLGNIELSNKKLLTLDNKKAWIFHGDVFDASVQHSKWIARLGGYGYDFLILMNAFSNFCLEKMGKERYSFSKKIKNNVKKAVKFIGDFEKTAIDLAFENNFDYVICGHIHQPGIREIFKNNRKVTYLNSGDWIENLTALEYHQGEWSVFYHQGNSNEDIETDEDMNIQLTDLLQDVLAKPLSV